MPTPRLRTKSIGPKMSTMKYRYNNLPYAYPDVVSEQSDWSMSDYVDEDFFARVQNGEVFNNECDLTVSKRYWSEKVGKTAFWFPADPTKKYELMETGSLTTWMLSQAAWYQYDSLSYTGSLPFSAAAQAKGFSLARVDSTPYDYFEDLAELGETIQFLKNPLHSISNLIDVFKTKMRKAQKLPDSLERAKAIANVWKQYRFALMPLVRSISNALELLAEDEVKRPARRTAHGFSTSVGPNVVTTREPWRPFGPADSLVFHYAITDSKEVEAHASIYYEVSNPIADWKFKLGLRLKDVLPTLWEIVPYSFMVDRLYNISNLLKGLINLADPTVSFLASSVTEKTTQTREISGTGMWTSLGTLTTSSVDNDSVFYETFRYKRSLWKPDVFDAIPSITWRNLVKDVTSILDLLAILLGQMPNLR